MQLSVREAAGIFNVSEKTIYRWVQKGRLPAYRIHEQIRFNKTELLEWAMARKINVPPVFLEGEGGPAAEMPTLEGALRAGGVFYRVEGVDVAAVLQAVVALMPLPPAADREFLHQVLLARESLASTGIGDGISVPHARNPIVLHVDRPMVTLCFLERPIDFDALDGRPVHTLFTLISPDLRAHLQLLSRISFALKQPAFQEAIRRQETREAIYRAAADTDRLLAGGRP